MDLSHCGSRLERTPTNFAGALGVLARLLLQSSGAFLSTLSQAEQSFAGQVPGIGQTTGHSGEQMLLAMTDLWLDKFDCVASPHARKLHALALCTLLTVPSGGVLHRLESIVGHITSTWFEVRLASTGGPPAHNLKMCKVA